MAKGRKPPKGAGKKKADEKKKSSYEVQVYDDWCKRCGICAAFCPKEGLEVDDEGKVRLADSDLCTGCRLCELRCPDFAIRVKEKKAGKAAS